MAMLKKYKLYVILAAMMLGEAVVLVMVLPGKTAEVKASDEHAEAADAPGENGEGQTAEIELGTFKVNNMSDPGIPVRIECSVYAMIDKTHEQEVTEVLAHMQFRIKESIVTVLRRADYDSIQEPTLATIKRQIKEATAQVLGPHKSLVQGVVIPDFVGREM